MPTDEAAADGWLIVGLGNPGPQYERTRHNLGFMVADLIAREEQTPIKRDECRSLLGRAFIAGEVVELAKPQTFMNVSGEAVKCLLRKEARGIEKLLVISDDLSLPFGTVRIRPKGSHGGHNGLRSIIEQLGTSEFARLRIGILPEHPVANTRDFVLQNFAKAESHELESVLKLSADAVRTVVTDGVERAMANFN
jgi:PTH1 family peptidyl-tRNA hydrolase